MALIGAVGATGCSAHKKAASQGAKNPDTISQEKLDDDDLRQELERREQERRERERNENKVMYGVPTMDFMIRGQVRGSQGRPVQGIKVNMLERGMEVENAQLKGDPEAVERWLENTAVVTDEEGRFEVRKSGMPQEEVRLLVRDVDGKQNGNYQDQLVSEPVSPVDINRKEAGGWNQGTARFFGSARCAAI